MSQELRSGPSWAVLAQGLTRLQLRFQPGLQTSEALLGAGASASKAAHPHVCRLMLLVGVRDGEQKARRPQFLLMEAPS